MRWVEGIGVGRGHIVKRRARIFADPDHLPHRSLEACGRGDGGRDTTRHFRRHQRIAECVDRQGEFVGALHHVADDAVGGSLGIRGKRRCGGQASLLRLRRRGGKWTRLCSSLRAGTGADGSSLRLCANSAEGLRQMTNLQAVGFTSSVGLAALPQSSHNPSASIVAPRRGRSLTRFAAAASASASSWSSISVTRPQLRQIRNWAG